MQLCKISPIAKCLSVPMSICVCVCFFRLRPRSGMEFANDDDDDDIYDSERRLKWPDLKYILVQ